MNCHFPVRLTHRIPESQESVGAVVAERERGLSGQSQDSRGVIPSGSHNTIRKTAAWRRVVSNQMRAR